MARIAVGGHLPGPIFADTVARGVIMEGRSCLELRIEGRVQGVGFRWATVSRAQSAELSGWVRNEPDGSVLCRVEGPSGEVEDFVLWCGHGPPAARVRRVIRRDLPPDGSLPRPFQLGR